MCSPDEAQRNPGYLNAWPTTVVFASNDPRIPLRSIRATFTRPDLAFTLLFLNHTDPSKLVSV